MKPTLSGQGIVLNKDTSAEKHNRYSLFSQTEGSLLLLQRKSRKSLPLDLFDEVSFTANAADSNNVCFLSESRLIQRYESIAQSYDALQCACDWASIIRQNLTHLEEFTTTYQLCQKAFHGFSSGQNPHSCLFKSLYLFSREEGYAVKAHWLSKLSTSEQRTAVTLINTPLPQIVLPLEEQQTILRSLKRWLQNHADLIF